MYPRKLEYLRNKNPEKKCLWGITTTNIKHSLTGSPCMAVIEPFSPIITDNFESIKIEDVFPNNPGVINASDLYEIDVELANNIIKSSLNKINLIILFSSRAPDGENLFNMDSNIITKTAFHFNGRVPLIYDTHKVLFIDELSDEDKKSMPDIIKNELKHYRSVTLSFEQLYRSNVKSVTKDLSDILTCFNKKYPKNSCIYSDNYSNAVHFLINSVYMDFYRIEDTIPIFNYKNMDGIGIEVSLTGSCIFMGKNIYAYEDVYRFVFSNTNENLFTIDGEVIPRPCDIDLSDGMSYIFPKLALNVPNDSVLMENKSKEAKRNEEEILCVE